MALKEPRYSAALRTLVKLDMPKKQPELKQPHLPAQTLNASETIDLSSSVNSLNESNRSLRTKLFPRA